MAEGCGRRKSIQLVAERLPDGNMRAAPLRLTSTGTADAGERP
ncbi:hypothetical protein ABZ479_25700 [Streptomyces sp. NPDC005722]